MSMRVPGHAHINPRSPEAIGVCDDCGFQYNHNVLQWQYAWRGNELVNLNQLVCPSCVDIPAEFLRPIILGPDPIPIRFPRPELDATVQEMGPVPAPIVFQTVD